MCPLCGAAKSSQSKLFEAEGWTVVQCTACAMVFLANPPEYETVATEFAWEESRDRESLERREREPMLHAVQDAVKPIRKRLRKDKVVGLMKQYFHDGDVIDIGCGTGRRLGRRLGQVGLNIRPWGIEIEPTAAAEAAEWFHALGGDVICAPAVEGLRQVSAESKDGALLYSYVEHESHPREALTELHRVLRPGSPVIVKTPNHAVLNRYVRGRRWCGYRLPDHVNYFTPHTLPRIMNDCGFEIRRFGFWDHFPTNDNMWMVAFRR